MTTDIKQLVKRLRERYSRHAAESNDEARLRRQIERDDAADALEAMAREVASLQNTFDLMWKADQRAIKLWQEATGKDHIWPDRTKTTLWLLERAEAAEAERDRLKDRLDYVDRDVAIGIGAVEAVKRLTAERDRLKAIGQKLLAKFDHPTAVVTQWDVDELRKALGGDA